VKDRAILRLAPVLIGLPLLAAASAPTPSGPTSLESDLRKARIEQSAAEAETATLEKAAAAANDEASRLRAQQEAAAQAIDAAEARISVSDAQLHLASAFVSDHRRQLQEQQRPIASLLAGLAIMAQRPPLLALADHGGTDELIKVQILLDSTVPVIRSRTARLSTQLASGRRFEQAVLSARAEFGRSRKELAAKRQRFASLEQRAAEQALVSGARALEVGDVAISAGEDVERLRGAEPGSRDALQLAAELASADSAPGRPIAPAGAGMRFAPFAYRLPVEASVIEGMGSVNSSGVQSRGLTFATQRGAGVVAPAQGVVRFSGPYGDYDGILILDHGNGWMTLIVNLASSLALGSQVRPGEAIGRALGPVRVELSQNGRRISPALIAGSSQTLSKQAKGG
jgi:murein hydrolase activator